MLVRQWEAVQEQQSLLTHVQKVNKSIDSLHKMPTPCSREKSHREEDAPQQLQGSHSQPKASALAVAVDPICVNSAQPVTLNATPAKRRGTMYSAKCFHKSVADVAMEPDAADHYDRAYLNTIGVDQATMWNCTIHIDDHKVPFKVNIGAEVTMTSKELCTALHLIQLKPPTKRLHGPDSKPLKVTGELCATLQHRGRQCIQPIFVVKHLQHNLLGLPAIQALHVLAQVDDISTPIPEQYPNLFKGLGTFKGNSYTIQLKPDAKPFALFTPRTVT